MMNLLYIFIGGGAGSLARYGISKWFGESGEGFPYGTLSANLLACVVLGVVAAIAAKSANFDENLKNLLLVGFCGGFSTFSTFSNETLQLIQNGKPWLAMIYAVISVVICLGAVIAGNQIAKVF